MIQETISLPVFFIALVGIILIKERPGQAFLIGWLAGYVFYGMTFAYHISTHDYYQLPLIPLVAVGLAPLIGTIFQQIEKHPKHRVAVYALNFLLFLGVSLCLVDIRWTLKRVDYRNEPQLWQALSKKMGMGYDSSNVIGLLDDYGVRLQYWALVMPTLWPTTGDLNIRQIAGQNVETNLLTELEGKDFFIVTDFEDFNRQVELKKFLSNNYPIFDQGDGYLIYDLRKHL